MRKLNREQKAIIALVALAWGGVLIAEWSLATAIALHLAALAINAHLLLQHVQIRIGRFTIGNYSPPRSL